MPRGASQKAPLLIAVQRAAPAAAEEDHETAEDDALPCSSAHSGFSPGRRRASQTGASPVPPGEGGTHGKGVLGALGALGAGSKSGAPSEDAPVGAAASAANVSACSATAAVQCLRQSDRMSERRTKRTAGSWSAARSPSKNVRLPSEPKQLASCGGWELKEDPRSFGGWGLFSVPRFRGKQ